MVDLRLRPRPEKEKSESSQELDQFFASARKRNPPQRWSTVPGSQARGATSRVSVDVPPRQTLSSEQTVDPSGQRSTELRPGPSSSPFPTQQLPIRRVPLPTSTAQYLAEAPGSDIPHTVSSAPNQNNSVQYAGSYTQLAGGVALQESNTFPEVGHSSEEPDEISVEGRTYRFIFPSHHFVTKPHVEIEGDFPSKTEIALSGSTDQKFSPGVSTQQNPAELSADISLSGESIPTTNHPRTLEREAISTEPPVSTTKTAPPESQQPITMSLPTASLVQDSQRSWITQGYDTPAPILFPIQLPENINEPVFNPDKLRTSVWNPDDPQSPVTMPPGQQSENHRSSSNGPGPVSQPLWSPSDCNPPVPPKSYNQHNGESGPPGFPGQSIHLNRSPDEYRKPASVPQTQAQKQDIPSQPDLQNPRQLNSFVQAGDVVMPREDPQKQQSMHIAKGSHPMSSHNTDQHESGPSVSPPSAQNTMVQQRPSLLDAECFRETNPRNTQKGTPEPTPQQHLTLQQRSSQNITNHMPPKDAMQQAAPPPRESSWTMTQYPGAPYNAGLPVSSYPYSSEQSRNVLRKPLPTHDSQSKDSTSGIRNWKVVKKVTNLVGGGGGAAPATYSPEEITRRCLDFMEQQDIPFVAGLDPFSSILVYARGKWGQDAAQINAQAMEIKNLTGRKDRYKNELESARREIQLLKSRLRENEAEVKSKEELLARFQTSFDRQLENNTQLERHIQEVVENNAQLFKEGQKRIQDLQDQNSACREAIAQLQTDNTRLQKRIASYGTDGFRFIADAKFEAKLEHAAQTINKLISYVPCPPSQNLDTNMNPAMSSFFRRNQQYLGSRVWPKFIYGTCWDVLKRGFFSCPLGFGVLGPQGDGFVLLNHLREILADYDPAADKLDILNNRRANEVRGFLFERIWGDASETDNSVYHPATGEKGPKGLSVYFHQHIDRVTNELVSILAQCSANQLDPLAPGDIRKLVRDIGFLALEMATQRAHVTLEFCVHGDIIQQGKHFKDETAGDGAIGPARVDLMTEPALTRLGNGRDELTEYKVLRKGTFVAGRT